MGMALDKMNTERADAYRYPGDSMEEPQFRTAHSRQLIRFGGLMTGSISSS